MSGSTSVKTSSGHLVNSEERISKHSVSMPFDLSVIIKNNEKPNTVPDSFNRLSLRQKAIRECNEKKRSVVRGKERKKN